VITLAPVTLERGNVRLEPLRATHADGLREAVRDGELWNLWFTVVPEPSDMDNYIAKAQRGEAEGKMLCWAVRDLESDTIIGSTRYHDVVAEIDRVEIGYTWYAARFQRTHVNTTCKLLLMTHAFDTLGCGVVGLRTDLFNTRSQAAIERLGAHRDGVLRHHQARRDGSARDSVFYSILAAEWPAVRERLERKLAGYDGLAEGTQAR
jgi:RimJ/RimL family protein N-acetyltransferase